MQLCSDGRCFGLSKPDLGRRSCGEHVLRSNIESCHWLIARIPLLRWFPRNFQAQWHGRFAKRFARIDLRESFATETPVFIARQADSHESLEFLIRANHATKIFQGFGGVWANSGKLGKFQENSGELSGIEWGFVWRLIWIQWEFLWGFRGNAGSSEKFVVWGGFGRYGASKGFCANSQHDCHSTDAGELTEMA